MRFLAPRRRLPNPTVKHMFIYAFHEIQKQGDAVNEVFRALSDPTRREILRLLRARDMTAGELAGWRRPAAMVGLAALTWPGAPERIPVHWNLHMQVDRYGGRFEGLLGLPRVFVVEGLAFMAAGLLRTPWALVASSALLVAG